jgi:hypothetical protein
LAPSWLSDRDTVGQNFRAVLATEHRSILCPFCSRHRGNGGSYIAAALPAHMLAELGVGMPMPQLIVAFATNCLIATANAFAVRR